MQYTTTVDSPLERRIRFNCCSFTILALYLMVPSGSIFFLNTHFTEIGR